jgi:small-conductance mechanosensitive channel
VLIVGIAVSVLATIWGGTALVLSTLGVVDIESPVVMILRIVVSFALVVAAYVLTGVTNRLIHEVLDDQTGISRHQTELTFRTIQVTIYVLGGVIILGVWDVDLSGLLVGAGFLGIVLGLAARQTIGSLIAGFVLMFSRPFEIGDWIQVGDREGIVTGITIINTRIQTFDGEYAMLPNDSVISSEILNRTRKGRLRIHVEVGVDYDTDLAEAVEIATEAVSDIDEILTVPQPRVNVKEFGSSAIVLDVLFWIDKPSARRRNRSRAAVIRAVHKAFNEADIKIPFPQRELMSRIETDGFRVVDGGYSGASTTDTEESDGRE